MVSATTAQPDRCAKEATDDTEMTSTAVVQQSFRRAGGWRAGPVCQVRSGQVCPGRLHRPVSPRTRLPFVTHWCACHAARGDWVQFDLLENTFF